MPGLLCLKEIEPFSSRDYISNSRAGASRIAHNGSSYSTSSNASDLQHFGHVFLLCALLAAPSFAGAEVEIGVARTHSLMRSDLPQPPRASHDLTLSLYGFVGTRWSEREVLNAVAPVARLIGACAIALERVELRLLEAPRRFHFYSTAASRELLAKVAVRKPAVFFVEDTYNEPAFDAEAIGRGNAASRPELVDTVWVAYGARDLPFAIAHELVHVLANSGEHSDAPKNLMRAETSAANTGLTPEQCERIRMQGETNGLLRRQ
jgi:hypothetical protein